MLLLRHSINFLVKVKNLCDRSSKEGFFCALLDENLNF